MVIQNANYVWIFTMAWMTLNQDYIIIHPFGTSFLQPQVAILMKKWGWNIIPTNFTDKSIFRTNKRMGEIETIAMLFFGGGWGLAGDQNGTDQEWGLLIEQATHGQWIQMGRSELPIPLLGLSIHQIWLVGSML
jgi:hypothetical protein